MMSKRMIQAFRSLESRPGPATWNALVLVIVTLAGACVAHAAEPQRDLVLITARTDKAIMWSLCFRRMQDGQSLGLCYSSDAAAGVVSEENDSETTVRFAGSWTTWLQEVAAFDTLQGKKSSGGTGSRSTESAQAPAVVVEEMQEFDIPLAIAKRMDARLFLEQVRVLMGEVSRDGTNINGNSSLQLLTADELREVERRKADWPRYFFNQFSDSLELKHGLFDDPVANCILVVGVLCLSCLPLMAMLLLVRFRTGGIPSFEEMRNALENGKVVADCNNRLDAWLTEAGEQLRKRDGAPPMNSLLDKLDLALERLEGLRADLGKVLGYRVTLTGLYADLAGRIARLGEAGQPATLESIFAEVCDLRRLRSQVEAHEARRFSDGENLEAWIARVGVTLERGRKIDDELRKMGATDKGDPLAVLGRLCNATRNLASVECPRFEELPLVVDRIQEALDALSKVAGADTKESAESRIKAISKGWTDNANQAASMQLALSKKQGEISELQGVLQGIAKALPERRASVDDGLIEDVAQLAGTCERAVFSLKPWSEGAQVDAMAGEIVGRLERLARDFFPETGGHGSVPWHERLQGELEHGKELTAKLETMEGVASAYLGLEEGHELEGILRRELQQPHRALRLRILGALEKGFKLQRAPHDEKIFDVLRLEAILEKADSFLKSLASWPDEETLWSKGVEPAFGDQWLHNLLRAALVLETYYKDSDPFERFSWVCSLADAFQRALVALGKPFPKVRLLETPDPTWTQLPETSTLVRLSEIRRTVRERCERGGGFIVDVKRFALPEVRHLEECHVILYNPADWDPSQERKP